MFDKTRKMKKEIVLVSVSVSSELRVQIINKTNPHLITNKNTHLITNTNSLYIEKRIEDFTFKLYIYVDE